ncbi:MAG: hypothetical protein AAF711_10670 [Planctomycetota bacterium]
MRIGLLLLLFSVSCASMAAPELSVPDRERLADGTTDRDDVLDTQDGFYVLLRNAASWKGDDFSGDAGAAVAPPPDYGFLKDKPEQARGNVYLIDGWLAGSERWPTLTNHDSDELLRAGDPAWGDQVTRLTVITERGNKDATVIVLFNDPNAKMTAPEKGSKVRIAARFHKLWTIPSSDGRSFTYPVFIGGAAETVQDSRARSSTSGPVSSLTIVLGAILLVGGFFVGMRFLMRKVATNSGGGTMLRDRLDEMRREREAQEEQVEEDGDAEDLPEDPVAALDVLRERHEEQG